MTASLGEDNQLRPGLIQIFNESSNAEGTVGADEIFKMVAALSSKHPEVTWFDTTSNRRCLVNNESNGD